MWGRTKHRINGVEDHACRAHGRISKLVTKLEVAGVIPMLGYRGRELYPAVDVPQLRRDIDALAAHTGLEFTNKPAARVLQEMPKQEDET